MVIYYYIILAITILFSNVAIFIGIRSYFKVDSFLTQLCSSLFVCCFSNKKKKNKKNKKKFKKNKKRKKKKIPNQAYEK